MIAGLARQCAAAAPAQVVADTATDAATDTGGEQIAFWILAPLALLGAVGMVFSRGAVHSALWLVLTMLCLGCLYIAQDARVPRLRADHRLHRRDHDAVPVRADADRPGRRRLRSSRCCAGSGSSPRVIGIAFVDAAGHRAAAGAGGRRRRSGSTARWPTAAPIGSIAELLFTDYLFPFELTSALLITAATGAMVLTHIEKAPGERKTQRQRVHERMRSDRMSPLPGPGVFATSSSNATPALLPDGSIAPGSVSDLVEFSESERVARRFRSGGSVDRDRGRRAPAPAGRATPTRSCRRGRRTA